MRQLCRVLWLVCITMLVPALVYADRVEVGKVEFARGSCAVQPAEGAPRMLGQGEPVYEGDNIQTASRSFAVLAFNDGAKVTVRPNSSFTVKTFSSETGKESARMALHIGGVHAKTGAIAAAREDAFSIETPLGEAKANNASYSVRLCEADCQSEAAQDAVASPGVVDDSPVVARAVDVRNLVVASNTSQPQEPARNLSVGSPLYAADKLTTYEESYTALVFRDGTRLTLQSNSELLLSEYSYQASGTEDKAVYDLITGGLRVLSGDIGKRKQENFKVKTGVATIGIRGTGFDLNCREACASPGANVAETLEMVLGGEGGGLYSYVWDSAITQQNQSGTHVLEQGQSNYIASLTATPVPVAQLPGFFQQNPAPRPDTYPPAVENLFQAPLADRTLDVPPGLYVHVEDGQVSMEKAAVPNLVKMTLQAGQAGYTGTGQILTTLDVSKAFQLQDPYPRPDRFDATVANVSGYSLLQTSPRLYRDTGFSCVMQ